MVGQNCSQEATNAADSSPRRRWDQSQLRLAEVPLTLLSRSTPKGCTPVHATWAMLEYLINVAVLLPESLFHCPRWG
jgi:hypothetical protein